MRTAACLALRGSKDDIPRVVQALREIVRKDDSSRVLQSAIRAAGYLPDQSGLKILLDCVREDVRSITDESDFARPVPLCAEAIRQLARRDLINDEAEVVLAQVLAGTYPIKYTGTGGTRLSTADQAGIKKDAFCALFASGIDPTVYVPAFLEIMDSELGDENGFQKVKFQKFVEDIAVRLNRLGITSKGGAMRAFPLLHSGSDTQRTAVFSWAMAVYPRDINQLPPKDVLPELFNALQNDPGPLLQMKLFEYVKEFGLLAIPALPTARQALLTNDKDLILAAMEVMYKIGSTASQATAEIELQLLSDDRDVQRAARRLLSRLGKRYDEPEDFEIHETGDSREESAFIMKYMGHKVKVA